jgi:hypothetical protein
MFATPITRMDSRKFIPRWLFEHSASTTTIGISRRIVIGQMRETRENCVGVGYGRTHCDKRNQGGASGSEPTSSGHAEL